MFLPQRRNRDASVGAKQITSARVSLIWQRSCRLSLAHLDHERDVCSDDAQADDVATTLNMLQGAERSPRFQDTPPSMLAATNLSSLAGPFAQPPVDQLEGATAQERRHFPAAVCDVLECSHDNHCHVIRRSLWAVWQQPWRTSMVC